MPVAEGAGSFAGLSIQAQQLKNYALGLINANPQHPIATGIFGNVIASANWEGATQAIIDNLWNNALAQEAQRQTQQFGGPIPAPVQGSLQPIPGQFQIPQTGAPPGPPIPALSGVAYAPGAAPSPQFTSGAPAFDVGGIIQGVLGVLSNPVNALVSVAQQLANVANQIQAHAPVSDQAFLAGIREIVNQIPAAVSRNLPEGAGAFVGEKFQAALDQSNAELASQRAQLQGFQAQLLAQQQQASRQTGVDLEKYFAEHGFPVTGGLYSVDQVYEQIRGRLEAETAKQVEEGIGRHSATSLISPAKQQSFGEALTTIVVTLAQWMQQPGHTGEGFFNFLLGETTKPIVDSVESQKAKLDAIVNKLQAGEYKSWHEVIDAFTATGGQGELLQGTINVGALLMLPLRAILAGSTPIAQELEQLARAEHPINLLQAADLMEAYRRSRITLPKLQTELAKQGLSPERISILIDNSRQLSDPETIKMLFLREMIDRSEHDFRLAQLGIDQQKAGELRDLYHQPLPPQDIVRIADKRVWSQQTAPKYGQYSEVPTELRKYLGQWGIDPQWADWLWAAHWQLPSPQQVFEMLHRGRIDRSDMETFLGLTDWLPFFRDKLLDISYNVLTRVDVRRLRKTGVIGDQRMHRAHLDMGYNEADALLLDQYVRQTSLPEDETEITALRKRATTAVENAYVKGKLSRQDAAARLRDLEHPQAQIDALLAILDHEILASQSPVKVDQHKSRVHNAVSTAYSRGLLAHADALNGLIALGASQAEATSELALLDLERDVKFKGYIADHAEELYVNHVIDYPELVTLLSGEGFTGDEVARISTELTLKRQLRNKRPTRVEIDKWAKAGKLSIDEYTNELRGFGYADKYVSLYVSDIFGGA